MYSNPVTPTRKRSLRNGLSFLAKIVKTLEAPEVSSVFHILLVRLAFDTFCANQEKCKKEQADFRFTYLLTTPSLEDQYQECNKNI